MVLGLVAVAGVLSLHGLSRRADESTETVRVEEKGEELDVGVSPGALAALDAWRDAERSRPLRGARLADDTVLVLARGQNASTRGGDPEQLSVAAAGVHGAPAVAGDAPAAPVVDAPQGGVAFTASVTLFSCEHDGTGRYACTPGVPAGACGYVLNPAVNPDGSHVGPGVTSPSLYVAAGPSWPCGTRFRLGNGQVVIVGDRGGKVHDFHVDAYCVDAWDRETCLPGIEASTTVEVLR